MVSANQRSLMEQTTPIGRSACLCISRGLIGLFGGICEDATYVVLEPYAHVTQDQKDWHNANSRALVVLFLSLSLQEFESLRLYYHSGDLGEASELS
jgi:hypothetical protein